jgi:beta-glucoside operon transcriptional antiterminator
LKAVHVLSHNAVVVRDHYGRNCIVTGKGVGFRKRKGDRIDPTLIKKVFTEDCKYKKQIVATNN